MALTQGTRLGRYEILAHVGKGGMGEVYRARDTRLGRIVAIKILAEELSNDPDRRARFEREARSASLLNHPNIAMLYDIGSEGSTDYIVSEFIDGESLRSLMNRGPVPAPQLVDIAIQAADGLGAAHAAGIVHRDLKPENLMLTRDGRLKILDFGIAKRVSQQVDPNQTTNVHATVAGVVLGTIGYMSPEQLSGKPVDARSDIFCFGVVLYEMAAGKPPFGAGNTVEMLTAILRAEPAKLQTRVPSKVEQLIRRCLEKAPERRFQSTGELAAALQNARRSGDRPAKEPDARQIPTRPSTKRRTIGFLAALAGPGIIAAIVVGAINYPRAPKKAPTSNGPSQVALVVDKLKPQGYVSDFAHVLDASARAQLERYAGRVEQATGAQMAIVTVDTLDGQPIEGFANSLYRQWGIGKKGKDEGILLLFAIKDRRDRLVVGRGLEAILPGDFDANVLRQARPLLRQGAYRPALFAAAEEIGSHIAQAKGVQLNFSLRPRSTTPTRSEPSPTSDPIDPPKSITAVSQSPMTVPRAVTPAISQPTATPPLATSTPEISRMPDTVATPEALNRASAGNIPTTSSPTGKLDLSQFLGLHQGDSYDHVVEDTIQLRLRPPTPQPTRCPRASCGDRRPRSAVSYCIPQPPVLT